MKTYMKLLLLCGLTAIVLAAAGLVSGYIQPTEGHRAAPQETVSVGIATWPGFAVGFVGAEKGFFDGMNVRMKVMDDLAARHAAFRSGAIDVMASSADLFVQEHAQGIPGKIVLVTDHSNGGDGIVAREGINGLADLKGVRVAFARATPSHYLLYKVLTRVGLSQGDVVQVKVEDPSHAGQAFVGGTVDAAVTWEPLLTQVKESGKGHVLVSSADIPDAIVDVLAASPALLSRHDALARFTTGWKRSAAYVIEHPEESAQIMAKGLGIKMADARGMMAGLRFADDVRNRELICADDGKGLAALVQEAGTFWASQGVIQWTPKPGEIISKAYCG